MTSILVPIVVLALVAPLIIRFTVKQKAQPVFSPVDPMADTVPSAVRNFFRESQNSFESIGFTHLGYYALLGQTTNVNVVLSVWKNEEQETAASQIIAICSIKGKQSITSQYTEFVSYFKNNGGLGTSNTSVLGSFKPHPLRRIFSFPQIKEIAHLFRVHKALVKRYSFPCYSPFASIDPAILMSTDLITSLNEQEELGYMYLDGSGEHYRPTLPGAYIMTWKALWPITSIRKIRRYLSNRTLLQELGV